jgi:hypothetical protein
MIESNKIKIISAIIDALDYFSIEELISAAT